MKNKGFTLIELIVVIAIVGILASVVIASIHNAKEKGVGIFRTETVSAEAPLPGGVTRFVDGDITCYLFAKQDGGLATASWNYYGGISCVK